MFVTVRMSVFQSIAYETGVALGGEKITVFMTD